MAVSLEQELAQRLVGCQRQYRFNSWLATITLAIAVGSSAVTTISVAAELLPKIVTAVIASLPAICVGALNAFRFEERSEWWSEKSVELDGFLQALRYPKQTRTNNQPGANGVSAPPQSEIPGSWQATGMMDLGLVQDALKLSGLMLIRLGDGELADAGWRITPVGVGESPGSGSDTVDESACSPTQPYSVSH